MTPHYLDDWLALYLGDCVEIMAAIEAESVDAIVTDPPYDLLTTSRNGSRRINNPANPAGRAARGFMGKTWDGTGVAFRVATWAEALRVAKPGAHLLAFGGTRTYHRLASAIEDAGWEIRDCLVWAYAQGFPKSLDVSKAIDKAAGVEREVIASATPEAAKWQGWGTALKPAWEPIVLARKPLRGTVAANVLRYGTGALNIDGTRIAAADTDGVDLQPRPTDDDNASWSKGPHTAFHYSRRGEPSADRRYPDEAGDFAALPGPRGGDPAGRWPANVILTDPIFDGDVEGVVGGGEAKVGKMHAFRRNGRPQRDVYGRDSWAGYMVSETYGDSGTYSRFFLIPKSDRQDREPVHPEYALRLHRERGECDKLGPWDSEDRRLSDPTGSTSPERVTSEDMPLAIPTDSSSATSSLGKLSTARNRRDTSSITSTATRPTIDSPTSSSSTPSATSASTPVANSETGNGGSPAESAASSSLWAEATGISAQRDGPSTDDAEPATSRSWSRRSVCGRCGKPLPRFSTHPTQKPTALMRHLIRLVTPPGGVVLDPFLGSGTTCLAAEMEGFRSIGIEKEPEYVEIARARLLGTQRGMALVE